MQAFAIASTVLAGLALAVILSLTRLGWPRVGFELGLVAAGALLWLGLLASLCGLAGTATVARREGLNRTRKLLLGCNVALIVAYVWWASA